MSKNDSVANSSLNQFATISDRIPTLRLIVASACNFSCPYCHVFTENARYNTTSAKLMTAQMAIECVEKYCIFLKLNNSPFSPTISFYGGEALLNPKAIIQVCKKLYNGKHLNYIINTNGTPITQTLLWQLPKENIDVHISLDGAREQHNKTRFTGKERESFPRISDNIRLALAEGFKVQVNFMITPDNISQLDKFVETLGQLAIKRLYLDITKSVYIKHDAGYVIRCLISFLAACTSNGIVASGPWRQLFKSINLFFCSSQSADSESAKLPRPEMQLEVHPDGRVFAPHYYPQQPLGTYDQLNSIYAMPNYSIALQRALELVSKCDNCPIQYLCGGSIRYVWQYHYETDEGVESACDIFRHIGSLALRKAARTVAPYDSTL